MPEFYEIDKYRLDQEWEQQPRLYREHAERLADAERDLSQAEAAVKVTRADVELKVRKAPDLYGVEKVAEAGIKAAVELDKRVRKSTLTVIEAKHKADILKAAVRTLEHRKSSLEELVRLWLADYFAEPTTSDKGRTRKQKRADAEKAFAPRGYGKG